MRDTTRTAMHECDRYFLDVALYPLATTEGSDLRCHVRCCRREDRHTSHRRPRPAGLVPPRARAGQAAIELVLALTLLVAICLPATGFARTAIAATFHAQEAALTAPPLGASPTVTVGR